MKLRQALLITIVGVLAIGCNNVDDLEQNNNERQDISLSRAGEEVVNANNAFAFNLLDRLNDMEGNIVVSPLSLYQYLSMVSNGASGDTKKEMESVLGADGLNIDEINAINADLAKSLVNADKQTTFTLANSLWHARNVELSPNYITDLKNYYSSATYSVDSLNCEAARKQINNWCEENTFGEIKNFIDDYLGDNVRYVSYSATYFRSQWSKPFKSHSRDKFYNSDGSVSTATYISGTATYKSYENDDLQCVEIPYGNGAFAFSIILPKESGRISIAGLNACITEGKHDLCKIVIPKFKVSSKMMMNEVLSEMGIRKAFTPEADFTNASLYTQALPCVMHSASIDIDERGTVAASAAGSGMLMDMIMDPIVVNSPFMFFIKEVSTSTILYIGRINKI